jgi:hypothetical protein
MFSGKCAGPEGMNCCPGMMLAAPGVIGIIPVLVKVGMAGFAFVMLKIAFGGLILTAGKVLMKPKPTHGRKCPRVLLIVAAAAVLLLYRVLSSGKCTCCETC